MKLELPRAAVVLGIESSCDETSAAVIAHGKLESVVVSSQFFHHNFGGVVPELASRAHLSSIVPIVDEALRKAGRTLHTIDAIAVTNTPGLMGSLLVGLNYAKGLSAALHIPLIGIHHIEAHIFSALLEDDRPELPFIALIVSGGHTLLVAVNDIGDYELLGETLDDAAGEAFDKVGKMLGLSYPAGPAVDKLASVGDASFVQFPRAMIHEDHFDFSFSGIKTSVLYWLKNHPELLQRDVPNIAASFQRAVVDVLVGKTLRAALERGVDDIVAVGGVSANSELRERFRFETKKRGLRFFTPRPLFSTDNAAMIAMLGALKLDRGVTHDLGLRAEPRHPIAQRTQIVK
jgi:N6-L-threonylcarbamoyladenine synthase